MFDHVSGISQHDPQIRTQRRKQEISVLMTCDLLVEQSHLLDHRSAYGDRRKCERQCVIDQCLTNCVIWQLELFELKPSLDPIQLRYETVHQDVDIAP